MSVLIFGGAGFVGLNLAEALLAAGRSVVTFDRADLPAAAGRVFARLPGELVVLKGDVTDRQAIVDAMQPGLDAVVLGAAITADAAREGRDPETILGVNLTSHVQILARAREMGVRRIVNLSSAAAYGWGGGDAAGMLLETGRADPSSLYGVTKLASEKVTARLGERWGLDVVSVRLSGVFGPWEHAGGSRDTPSPQAQMLALAEAGRPALLERPGRRDWVYGPDVADALLRVLAAPVLTHRLYNVSSPQVWPALDWGRRLTRLFPDFVCRLCEPDERPSVALHAPADRPPLDTSRLSAELGWTARFGLVASSDDLLARIGGSGR